MSSSLMSRFLLISSVGIGSYFTGSYIERQKRLCDSDDYVSDGKEYPINRVKPKPALPIFATVSAASPIPVEEKSVVPNNVSRIAQIMRYGFPGLDNVRSYDDFVLSYDRRTRVAHWVFEHLTSERVKHNDAVDRSKCDFAPDESIHPFFRSVNTDYKGSGFDRGHLAAAGNHKADQKHCEQTFFLTNMAPQVGVGFNRDKWNHLERHVRKLTREYPNVYCCTGPLYLPRKEADGKLYVKYQVIGANNVAVPTHFYKVIVMETADKRLEMESYVLPNSKIDNETPLSMFQVPPETVERAAGLLFFDKIARTQLFKINGKKV
ncbi:endonuclease G, mitochondrial [Toxorhynchites rutilus septentrionalis]|uniref:endonuclease G, mitochondrial n=1 Tax=Toxorhynchites rutilus septentrionalis TaxID=329112 RepID=UPI0024788086|nr:endonuclease G, mitochondrial [Toxorhynchites rutilus septentrionalis]